MSKIIIIGAGKLAEELYNYITYDSVYEVAAFAVDKDFITKKKVFGLPIIDINNIRNMYPVDEFKTLVVIGYQNINRIRTEKYEYIKNLGYTCINYISSRACNIGNISIGENCIILENNTINTTAKIGNNNILWSGNHIGHHSVIENNCYLAGNVVVSGSSKISSNCFIGVNASIGNKVKIGSKNIIGANSLITKSTKPNSVYISKRTKEYRLDADSFIKLTNL